jgi:hypothetical protein
LLFVNSKAIPVKRGCSKSRKTVLSRALWWVLSASDKFSLNQGIRTMRLIILSISIHMLAILTGLAQMRPVSVMEGNVVLNYTITRYVPVWEVSSNGKGNDGLLSHHRQFFQQTDRKGIQAFKDLIYTKGMVPEEVADLDAKALEARLSRDRFTIYYRIQYGDYSIFIGHLNNSKRRSIIPFQVRGSQWTIAPQFADTDLYSLLSSGDFDPYMGLSDGRLICSYGFEEVNGLIDRIHDYSGNGNHALRKAVTIVDGRFGGAVKLSGAEVTSVTPNWAGEITDGISINFHLQMAKMVYNTERNRTVLSLGNDHKALKLETANGLLRLTYPVSSGVQYVEWSYTPGVWSHISIEVLKTGVTVQENGMEVASSSIIPHMTFPGSTLRIGAANGAKATMDELRIKAR